MKARRQFLTGLLALLAGLVTLRRPAQAGIDTDRIFAQRVAAALPHGQSAAAMGRLIAETRKLPSLDVQKLRQRLASAGVDGIFADDEAIRRAIRQIVAEDFAAERMVAFRGWRFAEAEVDLHRLVASVTWAV